MAAHLQSFQINSLLKENLSDNTSFLLPSHLKPVVHSVVQSLSDGNQSVEQLNTVVVFIFLLHLTSIATSLIYFHLWEVDGLVPIFSIKQWYQRRVRGRNHYFLEMDDSLIETGPSDTKSFSTDLVSFRRKTREQDTDDMLGVVWPLRMLQVTGLWQPSWVPKVSRIIN
eukprot:TRINITY_DN3703_c0_g1_i1.p1 TRINITY_DN3703_c0_g1~~TRINITY_DN3703_c0_g1_i1.p1  ORF type:complete len:195 (-),score=37.68 TRINITY_DN3703_c0_g1_i1:1416-1922(-)